MHLNVSYNLGPGYVGEREGWQVRLNLHNEQERRKITNIIGTIRGREEPDRYVIIGRIFGKFNSNQSKVPKHDNPLISHPQIQITI